MSRVRFDKGVSMNVVPSTSAADALLELMDFHKITQVEFAQHIAISQKQLSFILNRHAYMSINVARKIEHATGVSADWLLQLDYNYRIAHDKADFTGVQRFDWA